MVVLAYMTMTNKDVETFVFMNKTDNQFKRGFGPEHDG